MPILVANTRMLVCPSFSSKGSGFRLTKKGTHNTLGLTTKTFKTKLEVNIVFRVKKVLSLSNIYWKSINRAYILFLINMFN